MNKTKQQTEQKILKEIEEFDREHNDLYYFVDRWQSQLKNLSKEEALQQAEKRFGKMTKEDSIRCFTCKEPFIQIESHTWKGNCKHIPKDWHFSKGGVKKEKPDRKIEILKILDMPLIPDEKADQILALLKTHPKEKPEKKRIIRCPKCEGELDPDSFDTKENICPYCCGQVFWREPKEKPEKIEKKEPKKNPKGCPCGGDCCDNPDTFTPEHECEEGFCEYCYGTECRNCDSYCNCDL